MIMIAYMIAYIILRQYQLLADCSAPSVNSYWHDNVISLCVCPSACHTVHCG